LGDRAEKQIRAEREVRAGHEPDTEAAELRAINERLVIAAVRQQELAETAVRSGESYRLLARNFPDGMVLLFDRDLRHVLADGQGLEALGLTKEALEGRTIWERFAPEVCRQLEPAYRAALAGEPRVLEVLFSAGTPAQQVHRLPSSERVYSAERVYQVHALPVRGEAGTILAGMAVAQDVTERRRADELVRWRAHHDALTGLPNLALLRDRLDRVLTMAARSGELAAVLFIDLDGFKRVNDTLGHATGDRLLQHVAGRLGGCLRAVDTVARVGGDEFVVLLPGLQVAGDAAGVARKIADSLCAPARIEERELSVTASIGVSLFPRDGRDAGSLLKHADAAMYACKDHHARLGTLAGPGTTGPTSAAPAGRSRKPS